jgi:hypothetical protein
MYQMYVTDITGGMPAQKGISFSALRRTYSKELVTIRWNRGTTFFSTGNFDRYRFWHTHKKLSIGFSFGLKKISNATK